MITFIKLKIKMGRSEWAFLVKTKEDIDNVLSLVKSHNTCTDYDLIGEKLEVYALLKYKKLNCYYLCIGNGGGREQTSNYIIKNYNNKTKTKNSVLFPFMKPEWFSDDEQMEPFWQAKSYDEAMSPEKFIQYPF